MRLCPTVEGSPSPLITHRIGAAVCQARQRSHFHKCHKCVFRGKPADWQPEPSSPLTIEVDAGGPGKNGTSRRRRPRPARQVPVEEAPSGPAREPGKVAETDA